jgi:hypothetical protein
MTKQQLIAGERFAYNGSFKLLATEVALRFSDGHLVTQLEERLGFLMGEPTDTYFMVWIANHGTNKIMFTECEVKTNGYD